MSSRSGTVHWSSFAGAVALAVGKIDADLNREALGSSSPMVAASIGVCRFRFPTEVIVVAVRWYLRYGLSYRDVEELLVERGVGVDHVTVFRWVQRFTPLLADEVVRREAAERFLVQARAEVFGDLQDDTGRPS